MRQQNYSNQREKSIIHLLLWAMCLVGVALFIKSIVFDSPLYWTFRQKHYWMSLFEILILVIALFLTIFLSNKKWIRNLLIAFFVLSFSYLHGFFYAFIAGALYALMIWMTGKFICSAIIKQWKDNFAACFVMGMAGLIVLVAVCSIFKAGTPKKLRIIYLLVFLMELFYYKKDLYERIRNSFSRDNQVNHNCSRYESFTESLFIALIIAAFMIQVGRANIAIDYDSGWYGLRSSYVLAPYTGIYDQLMMTGCVYVYSKGIEALSLAFSFDSTYSYVYAVNLMFGAAMLYMVYQTTSLCCKKNSALFATLCCSVTAGIMNMASTAKSDISTLFLQIVVLYFGLKSVQEKNSGALFMAIATAILSVGFKPSSVIFSMMLLAVILVVVVVRKVKISSIDWAILTVPLIAVILLFARTYLLTGVPLTSFGTELWSNLGMTYEYPYNSGAGSGSMFPISQLFSAPFLLERIIHFVRFLFRPITSELDHVIIAWPGILFSIVWLTIVLHVFLHPVITFNRMKENNAYAISLIALAVISAASMGCLLLLKKADGNYFMLMYAMTFIHGGLELAFCKNKEASKYRTAFVPLIICGVMVCIASHWSWALGFTPIDLENKGAYSHKKGTDQYYQDIQIDQIASALSQKKPSARVMVFSGDIPRILFIPAVADSWLDTEHWGNRLISESPEQLYAYYCAADMDYLLVDIDYVNNIENARSNLAALANRGFLQIEVEEGSHYLIKFSSREAEIDMRLVEMLEAK